MHLGEDPMSMQTKTNGRTDEKSQKTLADYLGDLINVESHIEAALDHQKNETKDDPTAGPLVQQFHDMVKSQRDALKAIQTEKGSTAGNPVSELGSAILGKVAGAIDMVRTEGVSKSLRDDYVAFNLAAISYTMMFTTATALGDSQLADISKRHLTSYAEAIQKINHAIPDVVVRELTKDDHNVQSGAAQTTITVADKAWKTTTAS
jgi:ferritin-like metal-binding protein YciE